MPSALKSALPRPSLARVARWIAVAIVLVAATAARLAHAEDEAAWTPDTTLVQQVESMARSGAGVASQSLPGAGALRIDVKVGRLDPRLRLAPCSRIEPYLPQGAPAWGATRMGLRCTQGPRPWNVSLPVTVSVYAQSTVARTNLPAGTVLQADQLEQAEVDLAAAPGAAVRTAQTAVGRVLARTVAAGAPLRQTDLKPRQYFAAGETVRVVAGGSGWQVESEGEAINAGIEGQLARVRTGNGRIVNARPVGDREVELLL